MPESKEYTAALKDYNINDGIKAAVIYALFAALLLFQGYLYTTNLSVTLLSSLNLFTPLICLLLVIAVVKLSRQSWASIGLTKRGLKESLLWGILFAAILVVSMTLYYAVFRQKSVAFNMYGLTVLDALIFTIGAIEEEFGFRGYLQTRLAGFLQNTTLCTILTAVLFLLLHYPIFWVASGGITFHNLSTVHIVYILLLHFSCSFVYQKTNCLWGAIILHFSYNIGTAFLTFS